MNFSFELVYDFCMEGDNCYTLYMMRRELASTSLCSIDTHDCQGQVMRRRSWIDDCAQARVIVSNLRSHIARPRQAKGKIEQTVVDAWRALARGRHMIVAVARGKGVWGKPSVSTTAKQLNDRQEGRGCGGDRRFPPLRVSHMIVAERKGRGSGGKRRFPPAAGDLTGDPAERCIGVDIRDQCRERAVERG